MRYLTGEEVEVGDGVLYRIRDDYWIAASVSNVTRKRIVLKVSDRFSGHRNTVPTQVKLTRKVDEAERRQPRRPRWCRADAAEACRHPSGCAACR